MKNLKLALRWRVPLDTLVELASEHEIEPEGATKQDLIDTLITELGEAPLSKKMQDYLYAGRGATTWFTVHDSPILPPARSTRILRRNAVDEIGGDPFEGPLQPPLSSKPKVVGAQILGDSTLLVEFAYLGPARLVEENYELVTRQSTFRGQGFVHINPARFEIRASSNKARQIATTLAGLLEYQDLRRVTFTDDEARELIDLLDARLRRAKHKYEHGDLDTAEVSAAPSLRDMRLSEKYQTEFASEPIRKQVFEFDFPVGGIIETVQLQVNPGTGSIWFRTAASEPQIAHVFSQIRRIKGF